MVSVTFQNDSSEAHGSVSAPRNVHCRLVVQDQLGTECGGQWQALRACISLTQLIIIAQSDVQLGWITIPLLAPEALEWTAQATIKSEQKQQHFRAGLYGERFQAMWQFGQLKL